MVDYVLTEEEREYLSTYDITKYERPSVTADIAVFAIMDEPEAGVSKVNYRKDPERELQILLVKRGSFPFRGNWALPGGFSVKKESSHETAKRELAEETGVEDAFLRPFGVFSKPGRDPRGWIISHGYLALIDGNKYRIRAGTDAWEAAWFRLSVERGETAEWTEHDVKYVSHTFNLRFYQSEQNIAFNAMVQETKSFSGLHCNLEYEILDRGGLSFDHAEIILNAWQSLRREAEGTGHIIFDLMPEKFTLASLQRAFELVLGRELLVANFRRKIAPLVIETDEEITGAGHRPAKLYCRNIDAFIG